MTSSSALAQKSHGRRRTSGGFGGLIQLIGFGLLVASVIRELRLRPEERTWHGLLFGRIPYDLRLPTPARFRATLWNPREHNVIVPTAFGVGWTINLAAVRGILRAS
jgi:hypothetical protein